MESERLEIRLCRWQACLDEHSYLLYRKNYNISYDCTDLAVRKADSESDKITIDRTKPEINLVTIDANGHKNDAEEL